MVTSPATAVVEPTEPKLPMLAIDPMLPCDPKGAVGGTARSSTGLVAWLEPDIDPLDVVFVKTLGGRQNA